MHFTLSAKLTVPLILMPLWKGGLAFSIDTTCMHAYAAISYISHMSPVVIKGSLLQLANAKCLLCVSNGGSGVFVLQLHSRNRLSRRAHRYFLTL